jgi:hypothetical protein
MNSVSATENKTENKTETKIEVIGNYYILDGCYYDIHFPLHYATNHKPMTGPECNDCAYYGSWRGVFIGYCGKCANEIYDLERGFGFNERGIENYYQDVDRVQCSAFDTYLKNVDLDQIGNYQDGLPLDLIDFMGHPVYFDTEKNDIIHYIDVKSFMIDHHINVDYLPMKIINALRTGDFRSIFDKDHDEDDEEQEEEQEQEDFDYHTQDEPAFRDDDDNVLSAYFENHGDTEDDTEEA